LEFEDWAAFDFSYSLDLRSLIPHILAIEEYKAAAFNPVLPPHWLEVPEAAAAADTAKTWGRGQDAPAADNPADEKRIPVRKTAKARTWIRARFVSGSEALSLVDILALHGMVAEEHGGAGATAGALRTTPCEVGGELVGGIHRGAPAQRLPELMAQYVAFIDGGELRSLPPVVQALLAHFFIDTIHPFVDGNGRTARLVAAAVLSRHGYNLHGTYALMRYFYRHEIQYHTMLHRIWKRCPFAVTPFVAFGIEGFVLELKSVDAFIKMKLNRLRDPARAVPAWRRRIRAPHAASTDPDTSINRTQC
jgi:hypothetical protein